jgi:hypothetical protein
VSPAPYEQVAPAMESLDPPEWAGARWIGAADLRALAHYTHLRLQNPVGYDRARLLVPEGRSVRGFVEVDAPGGIVSRRAFEETVAALPAARSDCVTRGEIVTSQVRALFPCFEAGSCYS